MRGNCLKEEANSGVPTRRPCNHERSMRFLYERRDHGVRYIAGDTAISGADSRPDALRYCGNLSVTALT